MERSKGLILIVVGLAAALIVYQIGFSGNRNDNSTTTPNSEVNSDTADQQNLNRQTRLQANAENNSGQTNRRFGATPQGENTTELNPAADRTQGRTNTRDRNRTQPTVQNTGLKIAIPQDITKAQLQVIYSAYLELTGGRTTRGGRTTGRGGFGGDRGGFGGGMMGGDMAGFGGGMMGGGMDMMNMTEADMEEMMNQMGGMMGGRGGFGGGGRGGMDMQQMNDMQGMDMMDIQMNTNDDEEILY